MRDDVAIIWGKLEILEICAGSNRIRLCLGKTRLIYLGKLQISGTLKHYCSIGQRNLESRNINKQTLLHYGPGEVHVIWGCPLRYLSAEWGVLGLQQGCCHRYCTPHTGVMQTG